MWASLFRFRRIRSHAISVITANPATPPTTPPAMAPTGVEDSSCGGEDVGDDVADDVNEDCDIVERDAKIDVKDRLGTVDEEETTATS